MKRQDDIAHRPPYYPTVELIFPYRLAVWLYGLQLVCMAALGLYAMYRAGLGMVLQGTPSGHGALRGALGILVLAFFAGGGLTILTASRLKKGEGILTQKYRNRWPVALRALSSIGAVSALVVIGTLLRISLDFPNV